MIRRPVKGRQYFTRSGLKTYMGKDRTKGHVFAPTAKGERTIYYMQEEIESGVICNPIEVGQIVDSRWGALVYQGYDKSKAKYIFVDGQGTQKPCTINDFIAGYIGGKSNRKTATSQIKEPSYEDFGRKASGARKDLYTDSDISDLSPQARVKLVVKSKIIEKPDFEKMYKETDDYLLTGFRYIVYRDSPAKADTTDIDMQAKYIDLLKSVWKYAMSLNNYSEAKRKDIQQIMLDKGYITKQNDRRFTAHVPVNWVRKLINIEDYIENERTLKRRLVKDNFLNQKTGTDKILDNYVIGINPTYDSVKQEVSIHVCNGTYFYRTSDIKQYPQYGGCWAVACYKGPARGIVTLTAIDYEHAKSLALQHYEDNRPQTQKTGTKRKPRLVMELDNMERVTTGQSVKRRKDAEGGDFIRQFGLSGEFGNWLGEEERRQSMNYAYDAFNDLAMVLGISPKSIGMGDKKLIIAFGSRGKGNAMAHYEALTNVINLTKMKGAGCVSHEYFHAIDYNVGQKAGCPLSFTNSYDKSRRSVPEPVRDVLDALRWKDVHFTKTKFYKDAEKLDTMYAKRDGYGYWASTVELFARAGDSFVKDELKQLGARNDYLCGKSQQVVDNAGTAINPTGKEAEIINEKYRKMIEYFKEQGWL